MIWFLHTLGDAFPKCEWNCLFRFLPSSGVSAFQREVNHSGCRCSQSRCFAKGGVNTVPRNTLNEAVHESKSLNIELTRAHSTCSSVKAVKGISALILTLSGSWICVLSTSGFQLTHELGAFEEAPFLSPRTPEWAHAYHSVPFLSVGLLLHYRLTIG